MGINILSNNRVLFFILIAGLSARLFLIVFFQGHDLLFYDADSHEYMALAENIRLGHGFSWDSAEPYRPNSFRTPMYPAFIFLARYLFGHYEAALIIQAILIFLSGYLLYLIGSQCLKNKKIALWSVGIFLFMPFSLNVSVKFLTQTMFMFILILAIWSWIKFLKSLPADRHGQSKNYFLLTSFLLPILALTRPIAQYIPAVFIFSLAYAVYLKRYAERGQVPSKKVPDPFNFLRSVGFMVAIFFIVLSPWLVRNFRSFGVFELSSIVPYQLYFYELPDTYAMAKGISYQEAGNILRKEMDDYSKADNFSYYMEFGSRDVLLERSYYYLSQYPLYTIASRIKNSAKFFLRDGIRYWYNDFNRDGRTDVDVYKIVTLNEKSLFPYLVVVERLFLAILFVGMLASVFYLFKENVAARSLLAFLLILLVYFSFITGAMASAGLRFPVEPIFILVGLNGLSRFFIKQKA